ncbi:MAG: acyl carrier protein [Christensenellales bacterium]|jgi:acyl carrier protein
MVFDKVKAVIAKQLEIDEEKITMESLLVDDLKADSLDIVELIFNLEEIFDIAIAEEEEEQVQQMTKVADIVHYIESRIA